MARSQWIDNTYYVNEDGKMLKNTTTPDGYRVDKDGKWIDNSKTQYDHDETFTEPVYALKNRVDGKYLIHYNDRYVMRGRGTTYVIDSVKVDKGVAIVRYHLESGYGSVPCVVKGTYHNEQGQEKSISHDLYFSGENNWFSIPFTVAVDAEVFIGDPSH